MKIKLLSATLAAVLTSAALADVTINFDGPQALVGSTEFFVTSPQLSGNLTGVIFHYSFTATNGSASYSSDMACVVDTEQFGYFNRLLTGVTVNHGVSPGATASTAAQVYTSPVMNLTTPIVCANSTVNVGYGNAWTGGSCNMADVTVTLVGVVPGSGPYPPAVSAGSSTPGSGPAGSARLLAVTVTPGGNPASAITSVTSDLSAVGGPASAAFLDNGLNGDAASGDGIYSYNLAVATGPGTVTVTAIDGLARTGSANININAFVATDVGAIAGNTDGSEHVTTQIVAIVAGQVKWLKFHTDDDATAAGTMYVDIDTEGTGPDGFAIGSIGDTMIGAYRPDGSRIDNGAELGFNDDAGSYYRSMLTFGTTGATRPAMNAADGTNPGLAYNGRNGELLAGTYYLAVDNYSATNVWGIANFGVTSANAIATGDITVNFRSNLPAGCSAADIGMQGGIAGSDLLLDNNDFIVYIANFFSQLPSADVGVQGGTAGQDGLWDNNDFIVFIAIFFTDQPNCNG